MKNFTPGLCPGQACGHTDLVSLLFFIGQKGRRSQEVVKISGMNFGLLLLSFCHFPRHLSADGGQFPFQIPKACFLSILRDDLEDGLVRNLEHLWADPIFFHLPGQEKGSGDLQLLQIGISGKVDDLHPIFEGRGNRIG